MILSFEIFRKEYIFLNVEIPPVLGKYDSAR